MPNTFVHEQFLASVHKILYLVMKKCVLCAHFIKNSIVSLNSTYCCVSTKIVYTECFYRSRITHNHITSRNSQEKFSCLRGLFNKSVASHRKLLNCEILLFWLESMPIMINIYVNFITQYLFIYFKKTRALQ